MSKIKSFLKEQYKDFLKWKCGKCGTKYSTDELLKLEPIQVDPNKPELGIVSKCTCGYIFHKDTWRKQNLLTIIHPPTIGTVKVIISTVDLELHQMGGWYETIVFPESEHVECHFQDRYETKEEAEQGHDTIVKLITDYQFSLEKLADEKWILDLEKEI